jgi:hypothetical protein
MANRQTRRLMKLERGTRVVKGTGDTFFFEGNKFVLNYARYLIQYLESAL